MATSIYSNTNFGSNDYWSASSNLIYNNLTYESVSRSGNTVTLYGLKYWFTTANNSYSYSTYYFPVTVTVNNSSISGEIIIPYSGPWTQQGPITLGDLSFTAASSATSATVTLTNENGSASTASISFPTGYVAPNTPTVSVVEVTGTSVTVSFGTESFGTPSTGTVYLYYGTTSSPTAQATSKTTTGQSTYTITGLTTGTTYYIRARAYNGQLYSAYSTAISVVPETQTNLGFYGLVSSQTAKIHKLLGSVNSKGKCVRKLYGSAEVTETVVSSTSHCTVNEETLFAKIRTTVGAGATPISIAIARISGDKYTIGLSYTPAGGSSSTSYGITLSDSWSVVIVKLAAWGITPTDQPSFPVVFVKFSTTSSERAVLVFRR